MPKTDRCPAMNDAAPHDAIRDSLVKLAGWIERSEWKAYDAFDGLSSPYARFVHRDHPFMKRVWQQAVRRFPINLRPLLRIPAATSSKAMGFFAQGYLRLHQTHRNPEYLDRMRFCLQWFIDNSSVGYRGYGWGNHFDYQGRGGNILPGTPTIVWTGLIAHAFFDTYEALGAALAALDRCLDSRGAESSLAGLA